MTQSSIVVLSIVNRQSLSLIRLVCLQLVTATVYSAVLLHVLGCVINGYGPKSNKKPNAAGFW